MASGRPAGEGMSREQTAVPDPGAVPGPEASEVAETRRELLAGLALELEHRGLRHRLLGADRSLLRVYHPRTGRVAMVLAAPASPAGRLGWSYLWSGGGVADAADPAAAAKEIARRLA